MYTQLAECYTPRVTSKIQFLIFTSLRKTQNTGTLREWKKVLVLAVIWRTFPIENSLRNTGTPEHSASEKKNKISDLPVFGTLQNTQTLRTLEHSASWVYTEVYTKVYTQVYTKPRTKRGWRTSVDGEQAWTENKRGQRTKRERRTSVRLSKNSYR